MMIEKCYLIARKSYTHRLLYFIFIRKKKTVNKNIKKKLKKKKKKKKKLKIRKIKKKKFLAPG